LILPDFPSFLHQRSIQLTIDAVGVAETETFVAFCGIILPPNPAAGSAGLQISRIGAAGACCLKHYVVRNVKNWERKYTHSPSSSGASGAGLAATITI
jgi:hypothetical protein